jgi:hypothetical protein
VIFQLFSEEDKGPFFQEAIIVKFRFQESKFISDEVFILYIKGVLSKRVAIVYEVQFLCKPCTENTKITISAARPVMQKIQ